MIKFEFVKPNGCSNSENAMVYMPGQDYVMFNGFKIQLDRVLHSANDDWVGCVFCPHNQINFIEQSSQSGVIVHSAEIISPFTEVLSALKKNEEDEDKETEEDYYYYDEQVSAMRVRHAAVLLKAVKHASKSMENVMRLIRSFDREVKEEGFNGRAKLRIAAHLRKMQGSVSLRAMKRTLQMVEDESVEIIHGELETPPVASKQQKRHRD